MTVTVERSVEDVTVERHGSIEVTVTVETDGEIIYTLLEEPSEPDNIELTDTSTDSTGVEILTQDDEWVSVVPDSNSGLVDLTYEATVTASRGEELQLGGTVVTADQEVDTGVTTAMVEEGIPPIVGENRPQDLNGDGLYRDINGNGDFTINDVQLFFQNLDSEVIQNNPEAFNFDETQPPEITVGDVQALFKDFVEQNPSAAEEFDDIDLETLGPDDLTTLFGND
jgi:PKD repeat protein